MDFDDEKIDRAVIALMYLGLHEKGRTWKSFDWEAMQRLHQRAYISDPVGKAKSVLFTDEGLAEAKRQFEELFRKG